MSETNKRKAQKETTETSEAALNTATQDETAAQPRTVVVEIAGQQVTLPLKFAAGMTFDDTTAAVCDAAYQRQYTNNMNANAKARADRLAKAQAANDAAGIAANQPYTADEIAAQYADYAPQVGGGPRLGSMEKLRLDAADLADTKARMEHNALVAAVKAGEADANNVVWPFAKMAGRTLAFMTAPRKTKDVSDEQHKANLEAFKTGRTEFLQKMLSLPHWAERIQIELDALMAQRGSKKADAPAEAVEVSGDVL